MQIGIVGCGYVADFYMTTLVNHPELRLAGVYDRDPERRAVFCRHYNARAFNSLEALLAEPEIGLILNLTNPHSHYVVTKAALEAGKHVYSEKPLAMEYAQAEALVELAEAKGLSLSGAPASILGEAGSTVREAVASGQVGAVRLVYAELEDGPVFREPVHEWRSVTGAPWPAEDEYRVGCTLEHAGYYLTWMSLMFGPVARMTAFASRLYPDKGTGQPPDSVANDFSTACLEFRSGVVARITCGLVAPQDRSLHIIGDRGVLTVTDSWASQGPVYLRSPSGDAPGRFGRLLHRIQRYLPGRIFLGRKLPIPRFGGKLPSYPSQMDFARGPAAQAEAIRTGVPAPLPARFVLHITEIALAMQNAGGGAVIQLRSRF
ncbi:Gfo/Idh/MocA family oxidoreductase [Methylobacterium mesophilicum]|uniref:Gfo/Idh/MocA family protein n=1 Tax=Methylobacterium mesophilicum TaxID=39956 RepID=UPI002F2C5630